MNSVNLEMILLLMILIASCNLIVWMYLVMSSLVSVIDVPYNQQLLMCPSFRSVDPKNRDDECRLQVSNVMNSDVIHVGIYVGNVNDVMIIVRTLSMDVCMVIAS